MGFFDDIFGGFFDFNGDGKTTWDEEWLGMMIINECMKEEKKQTNSTPLFPFGHHYDEDDDNENSEWRIFCEDGTEYGLDPEDFETEEEYEVALSRAKVAWRETCEDGFEFGVDPEDFETEEDYIEALEEAKTAWRTTCEDGFAYGLDPEDFDSEEEYEEALLDAKTTTGKPNVSIPITLSFSVEMPGMAALNAINPDDYPNQRQYRAAYRLCDLEQGTAYIGTGTTKEAEIEKCKFILNSDTIAGKYLTVYDGFIFAQAVKENFDLPVEVDDEDDEVKTHFDDLFMEITEEDPELALKIWIWCVKEFGPYQKYMASDWTIYNSILSSTDEYPKEFLDLAIKALGSDIEFCKAVISENPQYPYGTGKFVARALELDLTKEAQIIFTATAMNPKAKSKDIESLINSIISDCSSWEELETMERFKFNLLPIIKKMNDKRIQRLLPEFIKDVDQYIHSVESSVEKYQYSRRFAWRKNCADGSEYGLDPLDYETEEEYNAAIQNEKYAWRRWHSEAKQAGLDVNAYETEDEYMTALREKRIAERDARSSRPQYTDPLAETDKTVYNFCSVIFNATNQPYSYLTGDLDVRIGDEVVVPVGNDGKEVVATVVSTSQHMRLTAPFPVDKAKKVLKVIPAEKNNQEAQTEV